MTKEELKEMEKLPIDKKMTLTIREAAAYSNIGRNTLYKMLQDPRCPFVLYVGKRGLIKRKKFEEYIDSRIEIRE